MFTDSKLKNFETRKTPYRIRDTKGQKGLLVQITPSGTKTFYFSYQWDGRFRYLKLGKYPDLSLFSARALAKNARSLFERGVDPGSLKNNPGTIEDLLIYANKSEDGEGFSAFNIFNELIFGSIDPETIAANVQRNQVFEFFETIKFQRKDIDLDILREYLYQAFEFGLKREVVVQDSTLGLITFGLKFNPAAGYEVETSEDGDRYLADSELRRLFQDMEGLKGLSPTVASVIRIMLYSGQSLNTVHSLRAQDIDRDQSKWIVGGESGGFEISLSEPLKDVLCRLLEGEKSGSQLSSPGKNNSLMSVSNIGRSISKYCETRGFQKFTSRDIANTVSRRMSELGIPDEVVSYISRGGKSGSPPSKKELLSAFIKLAEHFDQLELEATADSSVHRKLMKFYSEHLEGDGWAKFDALAEAWRSQIRIPDWVGMAFEEAREKVEEGALPIDAYKLKPGDTRELRMQRKRKMVKYVVDRLLDQNKHLSINRQLFERCLEEEEIQSVGIKAASTAERLYYQARRLK